jgi:hypothetical protein
LINLSDQRVCISSDQLYSIYINKILFTGFTAFQPGKWGAVNVCTTKARTATQQHHLSQSKPGSVSINPVNYTTLDCSMTDMYGSPSRPSRRAIFDDDNSDADDTTTETDPFLSHSKMTASLDSHPTPAMGIVSDNIAQLPSPAAVQQDNPLSNDPPAYTPVLSRATPQSRSSYDSPQNDPWQTTPRTNGTVPVAVPNFPRQNSSLPSLNGDNASYLLDADHITVKKVDEKEGLLGFKHVNYTLASARRGTQVTRRYSDFAWYVVSVIANSGCMILSLNDIPSDKSLSCLLSVSLVSPSTSYLQSKWPLPLYRNRLSRTTKKRSRPLHEFNCPASSPTKRRYRSRLHYRPNRTCDLAKISINPPCRRIHRPRITI